MQTKEITRFLAGAAMMAGVVFLSTTCGRPAPVASSQPSVAAAPAPAVAPSAAASPAAAVPAQAGLPVDLQLTGAFSGRVSQVESVSCRHDLGRLDVIMAGSASDHPVRVTLRLNPGQYQGPQAYPAATAFNSGYSGVSVDIAGVGKYLGTPGQSLGTFTVDSSETSGTIAVTHIPYFSKEAPGSGEVNLSGSWRCA